MKLMKTIAFGVGFAALSVAVPSLAASTPANKITITVPVVLKHADVVFNMDHLAFAGKMPTGMLYMHLLSQRMYMRRIVLLRRRVGHCLCIQWWTIRQH